MDVAFGVIGTAGIALHSARRVYELVTDIRGAPQAVRNVSCDVKALSNALEVLQTMLREFRQPEQLKVVPMLQMPLDSCVETLHSIEIKIKPHIKIQQGKLKVWKGFVWTFREKEILLMQNTLLAHKQSLDIAINIANLSSNVTSGKDTKEKFEGLQHKMKQLGQKLNADHDSMGDDSYAGSDSRGSDYAYNLKRWLFQAETVFEEETSEEFPGEWPIHTQIEPTSWPPTGLQDLPVRYYCSPLPSLQVSPVRSAASPGKPAAIDQAQPGNMVNAESKKESLGDKSRMISIPNVTLIPALRESSAANNTVITREEKQHEKLDAESTVLFQVITIAEVRHAMKTLESGYQYFDFKQNDVFDVIQETQMSFLVIRSKLPSIIGWIERRYARRIDAATSGIPPHIPADTIHPLLQESLMNILSAVKLLVQNLKDWYHGYAHNDEVWSAYRLVRLAFSRTKTDFGIIKRDGLRWELALDLMGAFQWNASSYDACLRAFDDSLPQIRDLVVVIADHLGEEELTAKIQLQRQRVYRSRDAALDALHQAIVTCEELNDAAAVRELERNNAISEAQSDLPSNILDNFEKNLIKEMTASLVETVVSPPTEAVLRRERDEQRRRLQAHIDRETHSQKDNLMPRRQRDEPQR